MITGKAISKNFCLIHNLANTANDHKKHCEHNCNVSLSMIKEAAKFIAIHLTEEQEIIEAAKLIEQMSWY